MSIKIKGINHPAIVGQSYRETVKFYTEVPRWGSGPNLDEPPRFFIGAAPLLRCGQWKLPGLFRHQRGRRPGAAQSPGGVGAPIGIGVALNLDAPMEEAMETLRRHNVRYTGPIDLGYERSIYFRYPNGVTIEFFSWITPLPAGPDEADIMARATEIRKAEGAH